MLHSRKSENKINKIHERALRVAYQDYDSSFRDLLEKDNSITIHERNIKALALEIFKSKNNLGPAMTNRLFQLCDTTYNLRHTKFKLQPIRTVKYGIKSLSFLGPKIWNALPANCQNASTVEQFKERLSLWKLVNCPCELCKRYVKNIGFI